MKSSTFLVHVTKSGAHLVTEFESRKTAIAEAVRKAERYLVQYLRQGDLAAVRATRLGRQRLARDDSAAADLKAKIGRGVSFTITTRAVVPGQNRIVRRLLWNLQPHLPSIA